MKATKGGYSDDQQGLMDAVWDFLTEHSEILPSGSYFIKFHTDGKQNFLNRVKGRFYHGYHREDPKEKQAFATQSRQEFLALKEEKKARWKQQKKRRWIRVYLKKYLPIIYNIIYGKK